MIRVRVFLAANRVTEVFGFELHRLPAAEPEREGLSTLANDGLPCSPWPAEPEAVRPLGTREDGF